MHRIHAGVQPASPKPCEQPRRVWNAAVGLLGMSLLTSCIGLSGDGLTDFDRFAGPEGRWVDIDASVMSHASADADPAQDVAAILAAGKELDWLVLVDHSSSTGSGADCPADAGFVELARCHAAHPNQGPDFELPGDARLEASGQIVVGSRLTPASFVGAEQPAGGHGLIDCLPGDPAAFATTMPIVDRPLDAVTGGTVLADCQDRGGLAVLAAPFGTTREAMVGTAWDWSNSAWDGIEVFAGPDWDDEDEAAWRLLACARLAGRDVFSVGGSNAHGPDPRGPVALSAIGSARTRVWVEGSDWVHVTDGLRSRRTVVHSADAELDVRVYGPTGAWLGMAGDDLSAGSGDELRVALRGKAPGPSRVRLDVVAPGACSSLPTAANPQAPTMQDERIVDFEVCPAGPCTFELRGLWEADADSLLVARFDGGNGPTKTMAVAAPMRVRLSRSLIDALPLAPPGGIP